MNAALPKLMGAMKNTVKTQEGANGLRGALGNEKHGGGKRGGMGDLLGK